MSRVKKIVGDLRVTWAIIRNLSRIKFEGQCSCGRWIIRVPGYNLGIHVSHRSYRGLRQARRELREMK